MTREGAVEVNAATGKKKRISKRIRDADFAKWIEESGRGRRGQGTG